VSVVTAGVERSPRVAGGGRFGFTLRWAVSIFVVGRPLVSRALDGKKTGPCLGPVSFADLGSAYFAPAVAQEKSVITNLLAAEGVKWVGSVKNEIGAE